jgi:hypothetical protein
MDNPIIRICRKCITTKNINEFNSSRNKNSINSKRHICKECELKKTKEYYQKNKDKFKEYYDKKIKNTPKKRGRPKQNKDIKNIKNID